MVDAISLGVTDNAAVGRLDPRQLIMIADRLDTSRAQAVVASACAICRHLELSWAAA